MKETIQNRNGKNIVLIVEEVKDAKGMVILLHGLGGNKDQPHIKSMSDVCKEQGLTAVRFDTTNTFGESDGNFEKATVTNYLEDLEDVIQWTSTQSWYKEPFGLLGHSLGSISITLFTEKHPEKISFLVPTGSVISGELSKATSRYKGNTVLKEWEESGWLEYMGASGKLKRLPWSHMEDRCKYNILLQANKLTMPVMLFVGTKDESTPVKHQQLLFDKLPGKKELHVVDGMPHTPKEPEHLLQLKNILSNFLQEVLFP